MLEFLTLSENLPFTVAFLVMLMIGAVEAIGLGPGAVQLDGSADLHADGAHFLGWLGIGRVPLLIVLVVLLALFGLFGIMIQQIASSYLGDPLPAWLAASGSALAALPLTGACAHLLAQILPQDETTAIGLDNLVGRRAEIVIGEARRNFPARGRVRDHYGQVHHVMVEPTLDDGVIPAGATALLVGRDREIFYGLPDVNPLLAPVSDRQATN